MFGAGKPQAGDWEKANPQSMAGLSQGRARREHVWKRELGFHRVDSAPSSTTGMVGLGQGMPCLGMGGHQH